MNDELVRTEVIEGFSISGSEKKPVRFAYKVNCRELVRLETIHKSKSKLRQFPVACEQTSFPLPREESLLAG